MWKEDALEYLKVKIKREVFDQLDLDLWQDSGDVKNYLEFLEEEEERTRVKMLRSVVDEIPYTAEGDMIGIAGAIEAYLDVLNLDWIMSVKNGLERSYNGAAAWLDMVGKVIWEGLK